MSKIITFCWWNGCIFKNPEDAIKNQVDLVKEFDKIAGCKISTHIK